MKINWNSIAIIIGTIVSLITLLYWSVSIIIWFKNNNKKKIIDFIDDKYHHIFREYISHSEWNILFKRSAKELNEIKHNFIIMQFYFHRIPNKIRYCGECYYLPKFEKYKEKYFYINKNEMSTPRLHVYYFSKKSGKLSKQECIILSVDYIKSSSEILTTFNYENGVIIEDKNINKNYLNIIKIDDKHSGINEAFLTRNEKRNKKENESLTKLNSKRESTALGERNTLLKLSFRKGILNLKFSFRKILLEEPLLVDKNLRVYEPRNYQVLKKVQKIFLVKSIKKYNIEVKVIWVSAKN